MGYFFFILCYRCVEHGEYLCEKWVAFIIFILKIKQILNIIDVWMNCHMLRRGSQGCESNGHGPGRGRGRGHGHGSSNAKNQKEFGYGVGSERGSVLNVEDKSWDSDGWGNLPGLKVHNPPSRATLSGGWGSWCRSKASDKNQGGGGGTDGWGNDKASGGNGSCHAPRPAPRA